MKTKLIGFGEEVAGYETPVLNEREIRAAAGILFVMMFISLGFVLFERDFVLIKYVIVGFFIDFLIRVLINPKFSPTLILGRLIVIRQAPEYVGAKQKRFAWTIGLVLSGLMLIIIVLLNSYSIITGITCLICLTFLFFESAFGICVGCIIYRFFHKDEMRYCAGEFCVQSMSQSTKISRAQLLILVFYILLILLAVLFLHNYFLDKPVNLRDFLDGAVNVCYPDPNALSYLKCSYLLLFR